MPVPLSSATAGGRFGKVMLQTFKGVEGQIVYDDLEKKQDLDGDGKYDVTLVFKAAKKEPK